MIDPEVVIRRHAEAMRARMILEIHKHFDAITELSIERAVTQGVSEYGDASFHKTNDELRRERFEEYADALFYGCVEQHIGG